MSVAFQQVMDFMPKHNEAVYSEIKRNISQLLPFIGAGVTADFFGTWPNAIKMLGEYLGAESQKQLQDMIDSGKYLDAAQLLEDKRGKNNLRQDLIEHFSDSKLINRWDVVKRKPIYLLPLLFGEQPLLTTNFDQALERVYQDYHINLVPLEPTDDELVDTARKLMNTACVFKLHGSVTGQMMSYDKLVFTKSQYERHYGNGHFRDKILSRVVPHRYAEQYPVIKALSTFAKTRSLFFLGCSLDRDRTVEVLRQAGASGGPSFAIVACKPEMREQRIRELDRLNIRAILYEDGKHESLRIILEKLVEDLHPDAYRMLPSKLASLPDGMTSNPYVYTAGMTPLIGRDDELEKLREFVTSDRGSFCWWALTGPGGCGKSRLALELRQQIDGLSGWSTVKLTYQDYDNLGTVLRSFTQNTLVVADYVYAHARELGKCMEQLWASPHSVKLRLLLVEREGTAVDGAAITPSMMGMDWQEQLLEGVNDRSALMSEPCCWNRNFLVLEQLDDTFLREIIKSFAQGLRNRGLASRPVPNSNEVAELLKLLHEIDPALTRPLYAIFLVGAWMAGEDPTAWNREQVLDYIVNNEELRLEHRLRQVCNIDSSIREPFSACLYLARLSTALIGEQVETMLEMCSSERNAISRLADEQGLSVEDLMARIGLVHEDKMVPMEPDLIGEYFVYRWLCCQATEGERSVFLERVWNRARAAAVFFDRLFRDYGRLINQNPEQWIWFLPPERGGSPLDNWLQAMLLVNMTFHCSSIYECQQIIFRLQALHDEQPGDREVALELARGLFNLSCEQDEAGASESVGRLQALRDERPGDREVALRLAKGLYNLSCRQDEAGASESVGRLQALRDERPGDRDIALELAKALTNLTAWTDIDGTTGTVDRLEVCSVV